jgi:ferritin-like metal-binding protein YciE
MAAKEKTLNDLFLHTLKDVFYAEKQILKALPKMAKNAESEELRQAFETHRLETEGQIERLEKVFEMLGKPARGVQCEAINGIIEEGKEVMEDFADSEALDAGILAAAQAVEHYEITRYGSLKTWAQELGLNDAAKLLDQNLQEEKKTDKLLTELAEARVNTKAAWRVLFKGRASRSWEREALLFAVVPDDRLSMPMGRVGRDLGVQRQAHGSRWRDLERGSHRIGVFHQMHEGQEPQAHDGRELRKTMCQVLRRAVHHLLLDQVGEGRILFRQRHAAPDHGERRSRNLARGRSRAGLRCCELDPDYPAKF